MPSHYAIASADLDSNLENMDFSAYAKGKGMVFSNEVLQDFIREERRHEKTFLAEQQDRSLQHYSSGEQKKALLRYILGEDPDHLIIDNPFDALDKASVAYFRQEFIRLSGKVQFFQVFRRKEDILPFIHEILIFAQGEIRSASLDVFLNGLAPKEETQAIKIPPPLEKYGDIPETVFEMKNVTAHYDRPILDNITWRVNRGEFWQLIGPNGSGKTTILDMLFGNNVKGYGQEFYIFGKKKGSGESVWDIKKKIGYYSPAMTSQFETGNTAKEMILSGFFDSVGLYERPRLAQKKVADQWLRVIGLAGNDTPFNNLTPTQRCLTLIARAMVKHPPVLILDEATASLDDRGARLVSQLINKIFRESETTILYVSHRDEPGLAPEHTITLAPGKNGSKAEISSP